MISDPMSYVHRPWTTHATDTREAVAVRRAVRSVLSHAQDAADAVELLAALGLEPAAGLTPNRPQETP